MAFGLSKSRILAYRQCPRRLWLQINKPELMHYDEGSEKRFAIGDRVGDIARDLHPGGHLVETDRLSDALHETQALLRQPPRPLFEATFESERVLVRADLLLPQEDRWRMVEVKSATSVKPYHVVDAAVQTWVVNASGVPLSSVELAHIDNTFVYAGGGDYQGLLHYEDITQDCAALEPEVPGWIAAARTTLEGSDPQTPPGAHCHDPFECPFLQHCVPQAEDSGIYPVELLPNVRSLGEELRSEGYVDLRDVPAGRLLNPKHIRVWQATRDGKAILDPEAGEAINELPYPRYYIDFETIQFAVPIWAGTRPYAQLPFQWSCHIETAPGELEHHDYLAEDATDPRHAFTESLLTTLGDTGPVIVYNAAFERTRLRELASDFPDLASGVESIVERMVDLLPIAREHYYHPEMRGSWSIKKVLPTIAPDLAYDELEVADGGMAQDAYLEMIHPDTTAERCKSLREGLLTYCERDTFAMVRIAEHFAKGN